MGVCPPMALLRQFRAAPNLLTLLRLFIVPYLVIEILDSHYRLAFALFLLAGVSDVLDGLAARLLSQSTRLGQYLDPIADKLLLSTLFLVLTHVGLVDTALRHRAGLQPRPGNPHHLHPALRHQHPARLPPQPAREIEYVSPDRRRHHRAGHAGLEHPPPPSPSATSPCTPSPCWLPPPPRSTHGSSCAASAHPPPNRCSDQRPSFCPVQRGQNLLHLNRCISVFRSLSICVDLC